MASSDVLLVTANLGSIFEEADKMIPVWLKEFFHTLNKTKAHFVAIHCQEVGGKKYEETIQHVDKFIKMLLAREEVQEYDKVRIFLDEDFTAIEKFTALGGIYLVHKSVKNVSLYDFQEKVFVPVEGKEVFTGNIEHVTLKEKSKFPQNYFPDCTWSRKGFMRTRWNLDNTLFDLVNIHLFHDNSNILAIDYSPSTYRTHREKAMAYTINKLRKDDHGCLPFILFGDYNFRLDTKHFVQSITKGLSEERVKGKKNEISNVLFRDADGEVVLKVGKKEFVHKTPGKLFSYPDVMQLREFDVEANVFAQQLFEYPVTFFPSYPFSEDIDQPKTYMQTRCPGWCDRVMMSHDTLAIVDDSFKPEYQIMGGDICMGDHKPIYLRLKLRRDQNKGCYGDEFVVPSNDVIGVVKHGSDGSLLSDYDNNSINTNNNNNNDVSLYENDLREININSEKRPSIVIKKRISTSKKKEEEEEVGRKISVNGRRVELDEGVSFHRDMTFQHGELMSTQLRGVLMGGKDVTCEPEEGLKHNVVCGLEDNNLVCKLVPKSKKESDGHKNKSFKSGLSSKSFREVVSNVLKTEAIVKYMEKLRHRSESESDEEEDDEDGSKSPHHKHTFKSLIEKTNMGSKKKCHKNYNPCNPSNNHDDNNKNNNNSNNNNNNKSNDNPPDDITNDKQPMENNMETCDVTGTNFDKNNVKSKSFLQNNAFWRRNRSGSSDVDGYNNNKNNKKHCIIQ